MMQRKTLIVVNHSSLRSSDFNQHGYGSELTDTGQMRFHGDKLNLFALDPMITILAEQFLWLVIIFKIRLHHMISTLVAKGAAIMKFLALLLTVGILSGHTVTGSKVLFLCAVGSKSHKNVFDPLIDGMAAKGHNVTSISMLLSSKHPNVREIVAKPLEEFQLLADPFAMRREGSLAFLRAVNFSSIESIADDFYNNEEIQSIMKTESFDLIIMNGFLNHYGLGLVAHFKVPYITVLPMPAPYGIAMKIGNNFPSSFVPEPYLPFTDRMTFLERLANFLVGSMAGLMEELHFVSKFENHYMKHLPGYPKIREIEKNMSMIMMNSHFALNSPRPLLPNVVEVGGMHCRPGEKLPPDLEEFLSGAEEGFILFSMGSIVKPHLMPEETRKAFVNVFSRLKQRVLWKWDNMDMPDAPPNVKLSKWVPQQDVLAHKNIKLFITHGGLLSTQEAVYHGVPLLGLPIFADQDVNMKQAEQKGYCKKLEILDIKESDLEAAIHEVINTPSYMKKAKELSSIYRDQPQSALERAIFWAEFVIRHKGAHHLQSGSRELNFFQYHSIDVAGFLIVITALCFYVLKLVLWNFLICKLLLRRKFEKGTRVTKARKNQ